MEPYRKRRWRRVSSPDAMAFFTCARPGRSKGNVGPVEDKVVDQWVRNLPGLNPVIVSLLGDKPDGLNEFSFYSFYGRQTFQAWLDERHAERSLQVIEHPTTDFVRISTEVLAAVAADLSRTLAEGRTVVLVDSGGETRTRQVCKYMEFVEDTRQL